MRALRDELIRELAPPPSNEPPSALASPPGLGPRGCPGFALPRLWAGELSGAEAEATLAHADACPRCRARREAHERDRGELLSRLPEEALLRGVLGRAPRVRAGASERARAWAGPALAALAASLLALAVSPRLLAPAEPANRIKGARSDARGPALGSALGSAHPRSDARAHLLIGGADAPARVAVDGERLGDGERVRVEIAPGPYTFAMALSIDEAGGVSPVYAERGLSLPLRPGERLLPGSMAFDGAGAERVYVLLSERPLRVEAIEAAARAELRAAGSVERMGALEGVEGFGASYLLRKPEPRP